MYKDILEFIRALSPIILGGVGIYITLKYNSANKKLNHEKMEKDLFTEFNKRYDHLNDTLSLLDVDFTTDKLHNIKALYNDNKSLYHCVIDYFNLCGEQYYWKSKGRISDEIWNSWHAGMMAYYTKYEVVRKLWEEESKGDGYKAYYLKNRSDLFKGNI